MPTQAKPTWILVADGKKARFLVQPVPRAKLGWAIEGEFSHEDPPDRDLVSDKPGRTREIADGTPRALAPRQDYHQLEETKFIARIAEILNEAAERNDFERLVLIAPPKALGDLRQAISKQTQERVVAELDKDLTNFPIHDLPKHLESVPTG